jgi:hypothetical protein
LLSPQSEGSIMRRGLIALGLLAGFAAAAFAPAARTEVYNYTLAGASPGGLWSQLGIGVDQAMKAGYPGSTVTYQTTGGGIANVLLLQQRRVQLGIVHNMELSMALKGQAPFKAPVKELRMLAYLYNWAPMQLIMSKEFAAKHGIKTFEDIAAKKAPVHMVVNRRGNIANDIAARMLAATGASFDAVKSWGGNVVLAGSEEQGDLMKDRRIDMIFNSLFVGQRSLIEVGHSVDVVMLPTGQAVIDKVAKETGIDPYVIKANSYEWQPNDVPTLSLGAGLVVHESFPAKEAQAIVKVLIEQVDRIRAVHPSMKALTPELMPSLKVIDYHPGAVAAYKAAGLMK